MVETSTCQLRARPWLAIILLALHSPAGCIAQLGGLTGNWTGLEKYPINPKYPTPRPRIDCLLVNVYTKYIVETSWDKRGLISGYAPNCDRLGGTQGILLIRRYNVKQSARVSGWTRLAVIADETVVSAYTSPHTQQFPGSFSSCIFLRRATGGKLQWREARYLTAAQCARQRSPSDKALKRQITLDSVTPAKRAAAAPKSKAAPKPQDA